MSDFIGLLIRNDHFWRARVRAILSFRVAIVCFSVAGSATAESPPPAALSVVNFSGYFSDSSLQGYFNRTFADDTKQRLKKGGAAVFVWMQRFTTPEGNTFCYITMGLTGKPAKGRNPRIPVVDFTAAQKSDAVGELNDDQLNSCMSGALRDATKRFVDAGLSKQLQDIAKTHRGGQRKWLKPDPEMATAYLKRVPDAGRHEVFASIPQQFRKAFDYRKLQWVVLADWYRFDDRIACFSVAGVVARAPDDRVPRFPAWWMARMWEMTAKESLEPNAAETCSNHVAKTAVALAVTKPWNDQGVLTDFRMTREDGLKLVKNFDPMKEVRAFRKRLKVGDDSHCGLVIEVKRPVVKVQTMNREVWLKVEQLYPKGAKDCRFVNGIYQDPD